MPDTNEETGCKKILIGVAITVISSLLIALILAVFPVLRDWVVNILAAIWAFFVSPVVINWGIFILLLLFSLITIANPIIRIFKNRSVKIPALWDYKEDVIFGMMEIGVDCIKMVVLVMIYGLFARNAKRGSLIVWNTDAGRKVLMKEKL